MTESHVRFGKHRAPGLAQTTPPLGFPVPRHRAGDPAPRHYAADRLTDAPSRSRRYFVGAHAADGRTRLA